MGKNKRIKRAVESINISTNIIKSIAYLEDNYSCALHDKQSRKSIFDNLEIIEEEVRDIQKCLKDDNRESKAS